MSKLYKISNRFCKEQIRHTNELFSIMYFYFSSVYNQHQRMNTMQTSATHHKIKKIKIPKQQKPNYCYIYIYVERERDDQLMPQESKQW